MSSSASYAAPSGERRETRPQGRALLSWPVGADSFWVAHTVAWLFIAVFGFASRLAAFDSVGLALALTAVLDPVGFALTALAHATFLTRPGIRPAAMAALVLVYSVLGGLLQMLLAGLVKTHLLEIRTSGVAEDPSIPVIYYTTVFLAWSLAYFWVRAEIAARTERAQRSEAQAAAMRAELQHLRLQLDPHFLFNALNGVAEEIPEHPEAALAMLRDLTAYLRHSLDGIDRTVVTVEAEVGGLNAYLGVQRARFGDKLRARIDLEPGVASRRIASFLLQPLVENAVKHGRREQGVDLRIAIRGTGQTLHVEVENTGTLAQSAAAGSRRQRPGIGVENVRRRLALHYPDRHSFYLCEVGDRAEDKKVLATLVLEGEPCGS